jgi:hypothetical protein
VPEISKVAPAPLRSSPLDEAMLPEATRFSVAPPLTVVAPV